MKLFLFGVGLRPGTFYFIPTIRYTWEECNCWMLSFVWGNLALDFFTACTRSMPDDKPIEMEF